MTKNKTDITEKIEKLYVQKYKGMSGDEVMIYLLEELDKGTKRLNYLTLALIILTMVLAFAEVLRYVHP